ncbi:MAG: Asd/ArgC dimerization domain-containing protein [Pseudomonadota bacterium]|nr:Asd/ArgC dimerization domain-containing protein [Pseudomonadota bacterium]
MKVAVVGASGMVGQEILAILSRYDVTVYAIGNRSAGSFVIVNGQSVAIQHLNDFDFNDVDGVLVSAGSECAQQVVSKVGKAWVIDNSTAFRMHRGVSLVVPEIFTGKPSSIIASPNCIAIPVSLVIAPILQLTSVVEIWGSTYQSISGAGQKSLTLLNEKKGIFNHVQSGIGAINEQGISEEEEKITFEVQKILSLRCPVDIMSVRVPIMHGHSVHLKVSLKNQLSLSAILEKLRSCPYIKLYDNSRPPSPLDVRSSHQVHVGRVRVRENVLDLWVVSDNLYRGAAWNVCQISKQYFGLKEVKTNG